MDALRARVAGWAPVAPVIMMGDFNAGEQNPAVRALGGEFIDSYRGAQHPDATEVGTFSGFTFGNTRGEKIDHVFGAPPDFKVLGGGHCPGRRATGGIHPHHFPVTAVLRMPWTRCPGRRGCARGGAGRPPCRAWARCAAVARSGRRNSVGPLRDYRIARPL